jgi:hypothetical protein
MNTIFKAQCGSADADLGDSSAVRTITVFSPPLPKQLNAARQESAGEWIVAPGNRLPTPRSAVPVQLSLRNWKWGRCRREDPLVAAGIRAHPVRELPYPYAARDPAATGQAPITPPGNRITHRLPTPRCHQQATRPLPATSGDSYPATDLSARRCDVVSVGESSLIIQRRRDRPRRTVLRRLIQPPHPMRRGPPRPR